MKKLLFFILVLFANTLQSQINWLSPSNVASSSFGNDHPRIVMDRSGDPIVVWGYADNVMFSKWNGSSFGMAMQLNPGNMQVAQANWMGPDIASFGDTVYVVFKEIPETSDTSNIYCMTSFNGGTTFSAPVQVNNIGDSVSRFPTVTTDDLGNPVVAFMKFNPSFGEARWVVSRSNDFGSSFNLDTKASGWSSPTSDVCDCCPGAIVNSGNTFAMLYRDNNSNIRDTWAGISTDDANTFTSGFNVDQQNWMIMSCPSSGPDGFIAGDTLYSVFMNGNGGTNLVYYNKTSLSSMSSIGGISLTGPIAGLTQQNYPRMDRSGNEAAIVWRQVISGTQMLSLAFKYFYNESIMDFDTVAMNNIVNTDVVLSNGNIFVIWEDDASGTVKYRQGNYVTMGVDDNKNDNIQVSISPNPFAEQTTIKLSKIVNDLSYEIYSINGQLIRSSEQLNSDQIIINRLDLESGIYQIRIKSGTQVVYVGKIITI